MLALGPGLTVLLGAPSLVLAMRGGLDLSLVTSAGASKPRRPGRRRSIVIALTRPFVSRASTLISLGLRLVTWFMMLLLSARLNALSLTTMIIPTALAPLALKMDYALSASILNVVTMLLYLAALCTHGAPRPLLTRKSVMAPFW